MIVELLLTTDALGRDALCDIVLSTLCNAFDFRDVAVGEDAAAAMVQVTHSAKGTDDLIVWGVRIDVPEEIAVAEQVLDDLVHNLPDGDPVLHVCRFEDDEFRLQLDRLSHEVFTLEMKLRRVLSIVYLKSGLGRDPYNLLQHDRVKPVTKDLQQSAMSAAAENQLFHLSFSDYGALDALPTLTMGRIEDALLKAEDFAGFRRSLTVSPIGVEDDKQLIAGLRERMDVLEKMRNCIAHNRRPTAALRQNYPDARDQLHVLLDAYLAMTLLPD